MLRDDLLLNPGPAPAASAAADVPAGIRWSRSQDKLFESALVIYPEGTADRWGMVAGHVGRNVWEVREHYDALLHDVSEIESGRVALPSYGDWVYHGQISFGGAATRSRDGETTERKKGIPWSEDEHRRFLAGLHKYGKGDWRSISRHAVFTRTPTQVASHAQKYYLRKSSQKKEKKRTSIHDITTTETTSLVATPGNLSWPEAAVSPASLPEMHFIGDVLDCDPSIHPNFG